MQKKSKQVKAKQTENDEEVLEENSDVMNVTSPVSESARNTPRSKGNIAPLALVIFLLSSSSYFMRVQHFSVFVGPKMKHTSERKG